LDLDGGIAVNTPIVVSETRDGESIIMHHGTGAFFDSSGSGSFIWQLIERGTTLDAVANALAARYDIDFATGLESARRFVETLAAHDLVRFDGELPPPAAVDIAVAGGPMPPAELGVHTDLADMLLLDPIHEVDQAGWPVAAA